MFVATSSSGVVNDSSLVATTNRADLSQRAAYESSMSTVVGDGAGSSSNG